MSSVARIRNKRPLSSYLKVTAVSAAILMIVSVGISIFFVLQTTANVAEKTLADTNRLMNRQVSSILTTMQETARELGYSLSAQEYFTCDNELERITLHNQLNDLAESALSMNKQISGIVLFQNNNRTPFHFFTDNAVPTELYAFFDEWLRDEDLTGEFFCLSDPSGQSRYIGYSLPIHDFRAGSGFGKTLGLIAVLLQPRFLDNMLEAVLASENNIASIQITTADGRIVAGRHYSDVAAVPFLPEEAASLLEAAGWMLECRFNINWLLRQYLPFFLVILLLILTSLGLLFFSVRRTKKVLHDPILALCEEIRAIPPDNEGSRLSEHKIQEIDEIAQSINELLAEKEESADRLWELEKKNYEALLSKKISDLQYLANQMNHHFLLNTLSCIGGIAAENGVFSIMELVSMLSELFKYSLYRSDQVTLREEMEIVQKYFRIIQIRFTSNYRLEISVPEELLSCTVPKALLQPLVENAVYHGLEQKEEGLIRITVNREGEELHVLVSDNGAGIPDEQLHKMQEELARASQIDYSRMLAGHIGNLNLCRRIKLLYGEEYGISLTSENGAGTTVAVKLPVIEGEDR